MNLSQIADDLATFGHSLVEHAETIAGHAAQDVERVESDVTDLYHEAVSVVGQSTVDSILTALAGSIGTTPAEVGKVAGDVEKVAETIAPVAAPAPAVSEPTADVPAPVGVTTPAPADSEPETPAPVSAGELPPEATGSK